MPAAVGTSAAAAAAGTGSAQVSRRRWLAGGAATAISGAGLVVSRPRAARADSGDALVLGEIGNITDDETDVHVTRDLPRGLVVSGTRPAFGVRGDSARTGVAGSSTGAGGTYAGVEGTSTNNWGVHGQSANATGVYGQSAKGAGVSGVSSSKQGVTGTGATVGGEFQGTMAALRLVPQPTVGKPTIGSHQVGELACDSTGVLWFCTQSGTPGTWKKVTLS